jgi:NADPH:quinone reductase-like Zn-dependent oxidoreductase
MKAVVINKVGRPEVLQYTEVPKPTPGECKYFDMLVSSSSFIGETVLPWWVVYGIDLILDYLDEILVRTAAIGINYIDVYNREGHYPIQGQDFPVIIGK